VSTVVTLGLMCWFPAECSPNSGEMSQTIQFKLH